MGFEGGEVGLLLFVHLFLCLTVMWTYCMIGKALTGAGVGDHCGRQEGQRGNDDNRRGPYERAICDWL